LSELGLSAREIARGLNVGRESVRRDLVSAPPGSAAGARALPTEWLWRKCGRGSLTRAEFEAMLEGSYELGQIERVAGGWRLTVAFERKLGQPLRELGLDLQRIAA
jgi:hypothetical protein